jgi:hypothetical protein
LDRILDVRGCAEDEAKASSVGILIGAEWGFTKPLLQNSADTRDLILMQRIRFVARESWGRYFFSFRTFLL